MKDRGWLIDGGVRVNQRADAGIELSWVGSQVADDSDPIRTTFVLGVGQFRPWLEHGLFIKAGMGVGFAGNGIYMRWQWFTAWAGYSNRTAAPLKASYVA